jgi:protein SCO1/2
MKKYKPWIYLLFFAVLLVVFWIAIYKDGPFNKAPLAVINAQIPYFAFINQNGDTITPQKTEGKVYVAEYFFTTCRGICPKMNANMRRVYDAFKNENDFLILSHTCMPETDSLPLLKAYEIKMINGQLTKKENDYKVEYNGQASTNTSNNKWHFLTGKKEDLYKLARQGYMIDDGKPDSTQSVANQFIHTQFFALVDRNGRVRGIYDGLKEEEIKKLLKDIPLLLKEKIDHKRFMNGFSNSPG